MATGRPSVFRDEFPEQAAKLCALGATDADLADFFGVHVDTIYDWKANKAIFSEAIKSAKEALDARVTRRLFERAIGYSHPAVKIMQYEGSPVEVPYTEHYAPDTAAAIFWLKNRQPKEWRDKIDLEHSGTVDFAGALQAARKRA